MTSKDNKAGTSYSFCSNRRLGMKLGEAVVMIIVHIFDVAASVAR